MGHLLFVGGRYDEALAQTEKVLQLSPGFPNAYRDRGAIFLMQNKVPDAIAEYEKLRAKTMETPYALGMLGYAYARGGRTNEARQILEQLKASAAGGSAVSFDIASVHRGLGEMGQAFVWLERAAESRDWDPRSWRIDPLMADVVKDPR
jgi:Flp pilus assembly protein TadD